MRLKKFWRHDHAYITVRHPAGHVILCGVCGRRSV